MSEAPTSSGRRVEILVPRRTMASKKPHPSLRWPLLITSFASTGLHPLDVNGLQLDEKQRASSSLLHAKS